MLGGLVRLWLPLVLGRLNRKGMERLLGHLDWALRPSAGLSPFLAGAYCWKHAVGSRVPRALLRPLLTAICFAFVPRRYTVKAKVQAEPPTCWGAHVYLQTPPLWGQTISLLAYTCRRGACVCFSAPAG